MEKKGFYIKIYTVLILTACILAGLGYLLFHQSKEIDKPQNITSVTSSPIAISPIITPSASSEPTPSSTPSEEPVDVVSDDSLQRIVNRNHQIDSSYVPDDLVGVNVNSNETQQLRKEAADALHDLFEAAEKDGISLYLISGYRSYDEQSSLYYTYEERYGHDYAESIDDRPGQSEHQLGLAVDLGTSDHNCELDSCFADTDAFQWLQKNAPEYGFVERYPADKEDTTGVAYAPWNYRYIGPEQAKLVAESGLTLEEYYKLN